MRRLGLALLGVFFSLNVSAQALTAAEERAVLRHGPWPAPWSPDPSNRASGDAQAIRLGERLFFEPRLSPSGKVLCATCHVPFRSWQNSRARALGLAEVERNTPSILNVRYGRWFGWDGAGDTLWAQSIRPILEPREMGGSIAQAAALVRGDRELACLFAKAFGTLPAADQAVVAALGKALAAFQETLVTGRTPFDEFRDALERGDSESTKNYPAAAQRGLRIFAGRGNCGLCHVGPAFSNGEFHDTGVPFFVAGGGVDPGRRGKFRVPGLRNIALTAPYMHNGSLATLVDVVRHYSELSPDRLHSDGEVLLLRPLRLSAQESADLVAFLESLTESQSALPARRPSAPCLQ